MDLAPLDLLIIQWLSLDQTPVNWTSRLLPCHNLVYRF